MDTVLNFASQNILALLTIAAALVMACFTYMKGRQHGKAVGYKEGFRRGQSVGHHAGRAEGKRTGARQGYSAGKRDAARQKREEQLDRGEIPQNKSADLIQNIVGGFSGFILILLVILLK